MEPGGSEQEPAKQAGGERPAGRGSQRSGKRRRRGQAQLVVKGLRKRLGMHVSTLQVFLERACAEKGREEMCNKFGAASPQLSQALQTVLVARDKEGAPVHIEKPTMYLHELVDRAVQEAVKAKAPHVLGYGYRAISQYGGNGVVRSMFGVESTWVNTAVSYLKSWTPLSELHSMVGDSIVLHTLMNVCLLLPLRNNCFAQLTGPPLSSVVMSLGHPPPLPPPSAAAVLVGPAAGFASALPGSSRVTRGNGGNSSQSDPGTSQSLRGGIPFGSPPSLTRGLKAHGYAKRKAPRLPLPFRASKGVGRSGDGSRRRRPEALETTVISRTPMYYNSTFGTKAGLPGGNILSKIGSGGRPAAALTLFIFQGRALGKFGEKKGQAGDGIQAEDGADDRAGEKAGKGDRLRIQKGLQGALSMISSVLRRNGRVPYASLLQRHCKFDANVNEGSPSLDGRECGNENDEENLEMSDEWRHERARFGDDPLSQGKFEDKDKEIVGGGKMLGSGYSRPKGGGEWEDETTSVRQVCSMVRCVLRKLLPRETWGCKENEAAFAKSLRCFLSMRRYEKFTVRRVLKGIKLTRCPWLYTKGIRATSEGHLAARRKMCSWIYFVFTQLVVPLVRASFYVTENEGSKLRMTWYRKNVWARVRASSVLGSKYKKLTSTQAANVGGIPKSCPGALRLLPKGKGKGVRPILNLGRQKFPSKAHPQGIKSVNFRLREALAVLSLETRRDPLAFGSTVRGQSQMLQALLPVIRTWKGAGKPQMHFASVDIEKSFDTLKVPKLLEVVDQTLGEDEYLIRRFAAWKPDQGLRFKSRAVPANLYTQFVAEASVLSESTRNCIFTDLVEYSYVKRADISKLVAQHLQGNVVEMGNKPHLQTGGIPQGSVLSSLLCCLMYGHLEGSRLSSLPSTHTRRSREGVGKDLADSTGQKGGKDGKDARDMSLLMRVVDDFLYLSPSSSHAKAFVRTMSSGNPDYGAKMNGKKSKVNFPVKICVDGAFVDLPMLGGSGTNGDGLIRWCGLVIDSRRLCVSLDLRRFIGYHIRDALTMPSPPKSASVTLQRPGAFSRAIKDKVIAAAKSKFHPILLDREINPPAQILQNIYQVLAITAMKHVSYVQSSHSVGIQASVIVAIIRSIHPFIIGIAKRKEFQDLGVSISIRKDDFQWLGLDSYVRVLKKKGPVFRDTVAELQAEKLKVEASNRFCGEKSVLSWLTTISKQSWTAELKTIRF